jgi:PAS domain S-box-containing protein
MAVHTAVLFMVLVLGIFAARPDQPPAATLSNDMAGGQMARRLIVAAIFIPFTLGWLRLQGQRLGLYGTEFGLALFATSNVVVFVGLIYWTATMLNQTDLAREKTIAERAQIALANTQLLTQVQQYATEQERVVAARTAELRVALTRTEILYQISRETHASADLTSLLQTIVDRIAVVLPADRSVLMLIDLDRQQISHFVRAGAGSHDVIEVAFAEIWDGLSGWALREQQAAVSPNGHDDPRESAAVQQRRRDTYCGAIVVVPLRYREHMLGTLTVINRQDQPDFEFDDVELLQAIANQAAISIANTRLVQSLRDSEAKLRTLFDVLPVGVFMLDHQQQVVDANPALERILTVTHQGLVDGGYRERQVIAPDGTPFPAAQIPSRRAIEERRPILDVEMGIIIETGQTVWTHVSAAPLQTADLSVVVAVTDVTERRRAELQISAALREKDALLKEIHHRVKNNLQLISSMLRLQSQTIPDAAARELLIESQRRVRSMALVHEQLYRSHDLGQIDINGYINRLVTYLRRSHIQTPANIQFHVQTDTIALSIDRAIPVGLIINELVTNSLKHAFPADGAHTANTIWISLNHAPPEAPEHPALVLVVGDNGRGLPDHVDIASTESMGFQLIHAFVLQLGGNLSIKRESGTIFTIHIPERASA